LSVAETGGFKLVSESGLDLDGDENGVHVVSLLRAGFERSRQQRLYGPGITP
jgi:hypothetical protein